MTIRFLIAGMVAVSLPFLVAPAFPEEAAPLLDCPLRDTPYSVDLPLIELLISPSARAAAAEAAPGVLDRVPAARFPTEPPSMGAIMSLRQIAAMGLATPEQLEKIDAALQKVAISDEDRRARCARYDADLASLEVPAAPVRILVFDKINGFDHGPSVVAATAAIKTLVGKRGWAVTVSGSGGVFTPEILAQFDAVVWNNNSGDVLTLTQRAAFEAYMEGGGGFLGLHGAGGDSIYLWDWYADKLLGARFIGHPMNPQFQDASLEVEEHPDGLGKSLRPGWTMNDEWYSFSKSARENGANVVVTLDEATYKPNGIMAQDLRMGEDHPIVWTRCIGTGRAFYSAVGHRPEAYEEPRYMTLLDEGLAWAAGQGAASCESAP